MKHFLLLLLAFMPVWNLSAQESYSMNIDSIEKSFKYEHGSIALNGDIGTIKVPAGYKYLDQKQAEHVLVDIWGNPKSENITLGLLLPENQGVISDSGYVFNIQYDEIGYVKDKDADKIDYDDLLKQIQKDTEEENKERKKEGYEPISVVGWASAPFYDADKKILHWAKEIKFGNAQVNTLNYNIRILGRKGVLVLNAISTMPCLPQVKKDIHNVLNIVEFNDGMKYKDFNPSIDKVAAWSIGGLVAGKILAKVGLFAVILKFWKLIALAVGGAFAGFFKWFKRKKENEVDQEIKSLNSSNNS